MTHPNDRVKPARPIEIVGVGKWPSVSAAARDLRIPRQHVKWLLKPRLPKDCRIDYVQGLNDWGGQ